MAPVCGEDDGGVCEGAGGGLELAVEEFVKAAEGAGWLGEVCRVEGVFLDEGGDAGGGCGGGHAFPIPFGEGGALDEGVEGEFAEGIPVDPAEGGFAVDFFGFGFSGVTVKVSDGFHGGIEGGDEF